MFEKVSQVAEQAANNVSRRQFFGRFGRGAAAAAAVAAGLVAFPGLASAGRKPRVSCSNTSSYLCVDRYVGDKCLGNGHCRAYEGTNECYCEAHGRKKGGPGGGPRR